MIAMFAAFVAFVALPAEPALPSIETPVRLWGALARFSAMVVVPMCNDELAKTVDGIVPVNSPAGKPVSPVPAPANPVAVKTPVDGLNWYLVDDEKTVVRLPEVWLANSGYLVALVVVSSVTVA